MAISIDALLAVFVFIALVAFIATSPISQIPETQPMLSANQILDDAIAAMDSTGFIMEVIEETGTAEDIETELGNLLPETIGFRVEMWKYWSELDEPGDLCRFGDITSQEFGTCFPELPTLEFAIGEAVIPEDKDIFHGKKIFVKKEPGDCVEAELSEKKEIIQKPEPFALYFLGVCDNGIDDEDGIGWEADKIDCDDPSCADDPACQLDYIFSITTEVEDPVGSENWVDVCPLICPIEGVECNQDAKITLQVERDTGGKRNPVDMIFAVAKNKTMAECGIASGRAETPIKDVDETGSISPTFSPEPNLDFTLVGDPVGAFDIVLSWEGECTEGVDCPEFYIKSPTLPTPIEYGFEKATTEQNSLVCNEYAVGSAAAQSVKAYYYSRKYYDYLALGSAKAEAGDWQVYVQNISGIDYHFKVKYIENNHFDETEATLIGAWNQPISKVDIAKVLVTEFTQRAEWKGAGSDLPTEMRDKYGYAEVGLNNTSPGDGSEVKINGLRDAKDLGTPLVSHLKQLDKFIADIDEPHYSYAIMKDGVINDELRKDWLDHTKFVIVYGDSDNTEDLPTYTIENAIIDSQQDLSDPLNPIPGVYYYTIDFSNDLKIGQENCANSDFVNLSNGTGGFCQAASGEDTLDTVLNIITREIGDKAGVDPTVGSVTITMPFPSDFDTSWLDMTGAWGHSWSNGDQTLTFDTVTIVGGIWSTDFKMNVPCDFEGCDTFYDGTTTVQIPPVGTIMDYEIDGVPQPQIQIDEGEITDVSILYKDLELQYNGGTFWGTDEVRLDYTIVNKGYGEINLENDITKDGGSPMNIVQFHGDGGNCDSETATEVEDQAFVGIPSLNPSLPDAPVPPELANANAQTDVPDSGWICIYVNQPTDPNPTLDARDLKECSENNFQKVNCEVPLTYVYVLDYWTWHK